MICSWRRSCIFPQMRKTSAYLDSQQDAVIWASIERNSDAEGDTRFGWNHAEARGQARSRLTAGRARPLCRVHSGQRRSRTRAVAQPSWDRIQISICLPGGRNFRTFLSRVCRYKWCIRCCVFFFARLLFLFFDFQLFSMSNEFFSDKFPATRFTMRKAW